MTTPIKDTTPTAAATPAEAETRQEEQAAPRLRARGGGMPVADYSTEVDAAIKLGLNAMVGRWNGQMQMFENIPDAKTRLEAAKLALAYSEGMPVQRQLRIEGAFKDRHAEMLEVARTPSGRKLLLAMGAIDDDWLARAGIESQK
jgi:hypothetical protein